MKAIRTLCSGSSFRISTFPILVAGCFLAGIGFESSMAYPPAPPHVIYGMVRDEMGEPLVVTNAQIILETSAGTSIKGVVIPFLAPGINYRLNVPMDAGLTADPYKPTALRPFVPFRLKVKIGNMVYLPMEMSANYSALGKPAQSTRLDLTLGQDSNGDGLPDAWQYAVIAALGGNLTLNDITPNGDADGDGISNMDEYLAGTYAFDPQDGFRLNMLASDGRTTWLEFLTLPGRSYTLLGSADLLTWVQLRFRIPSEGASAPLHDTYQAKDVRILQIEAAADELSSDRVFFKTQVR